MIKTTAAVIFTALALLLQPVYGDTRIQQKITDDGCIEFSNREIVRQKGGPCDRPPMPSTYDHMIIPRARSQGVDPLLVKCIISVESGFKPDAVSVAGAMGLMQLMQDTASCYNVTDPLDPAENLRAGISHFASLLKYFNGEEELALAAYHAGLGRVKRRMAIPPIRDTQEYVKKVMALYGKKTGNGENIKKLYQRMEADGNLVIFTQ